MSITPETLALFRLFCDSESCRYALSEPFVQSGKLYATDGKVAVSTACDVPDTVIEGRFPNMSKVLDCDVEVTTPWDVTVADCATCGGTGSLESTKCIHCNGSGECGECNGSGTDTCSHCDGEIECECCDGTGHCEDCFGTGTTDPQKSKCPACKDQATVVGDVELASSVARRIGLLKDVRYAITEMSGGSKAVVFESSDGIRGLAMCLRSKD